MEDQQLLENANPEFLTLSFSDQVLDSHPEQLSNECTDIILSSDNCQTINCMAPLNDLLLGQTYIIETNEQPLFVNGTQLITFQNIDSNGQIDNIQTISAIGTEKSTIQCINLTTDHFQDIYSSFNKTNSSVVKTTNDRDNLKEHIDNLNTTDIDITRGNYSNSTAIKILDDVAKSPTDSNGHFVCDLCLCEFHNWKYYKRHKLEHLNDKPFKCLKCLKSFNYNNNYLLHIASHLTNNLRCPQCKKEFKRIASFKSHLKIHKIEETITCNICYKIFDNQYRLDIHKESCMQENIIDLENSIDITSATCLTTCKICDKTLSTISEYKIHIKEHRKFDSVLKKQYKFTKKLKKVVHTNNGKIEKKFKCDQCEWSFNKSNLLRRHIRTHTGEKPFECSFCSKLFTQQNSLNRHLLKHNGLRPFKCEFCEMNFSQKGHLINHVKRCHAVTKEATRIHKCSICPCVYNSLNALNKHLNVYHGMKTKATRNTSINEQKSVESDNINETMSLIKDTSKLEKWLEEVAHELQSDINTELKDCNDPISTECEFRLNLIENEPYTLVEQDISEMSSMKTNLNEIENAIYSPQNSGNGIVSKEKQVNQVLVNCHVENQDKEVRINVSSNNSIPINVKEVSNKVPSMKKNFSETHSKLNVKTTASKKKDVSTLNVKNNNSSHSTAKETTNESDPKVLYLPNITTNIEDVNVPNMNKLLPKMCQFCGKHFKKNADLERHERTHTGDKPYKCDKQGCNKAFATKSSLEYHTITHLGKMKRAACPQCNGLFATTSSMKVHMRQHTGEKPFKCPVCGDAFRTTGHLHTHVIIHERKKKRK